jgi:MinD-like ATPase involved in chromosome partitioning or flagellar assembly
MSRLTFAILTQRPADDPAVVALLGLASGLGMAVLPVHGADRAALFAQVAEWKMLPEIVFIDRPDGMGAEDTIYAFGDVAPEGDAEIILAGVPNDIDVYRQMKGLGVVEIFIDFPTADDLRPTLEIIATREARSIGIDPRRVVYVWSASGGAGGTTFALAFANRFAQEGRRTLLLDLDVFAAPVSYMLNANAGAQETSGLLDILASPSRVDALFLERAIQKAAGRENLFYLSSRRRSNEMAFDSKSVSTIIARAQQNFDMVVVDTPWRVNPEPDWARVNGPSYIVATPAPQSLLGFSTVLKELSGGALKSTITGIINKSGELKGGDIPQKVFADGFNGKLFPFPYDPTEAGRLFFEQRTLDQVGGKVRRPLVPILATLPARAQLGRDKSGAAAAPGAAPIKSKSSSGGGFFSRFGKKK